jgi:hypothetical protein
MDNVPSPQSPATAPTTQSGGKGSIKIERSLLRRAKSDDPSAVVTMFKQFVPADEDIVHADYFGIQGIWWFGLHSFACLTSRRVASLRVGRFGEVIYQDGFLEYINSGVVYQPSRLVLFLVGFLIILAGVVYAGSCFVTFPAPQSFLLAIAVLLLTLLLIVVWVRVFYRLVKCGLVLWIREGIPVYFFSNRGRIMMANALYRSFTNVREARLRVVGPI